MKSVSKSNTQLGLDIFISTNNHCQRSVVLESFGPG